MFLHASTSHVYFLPFEEFQLSDNIPNYQRNFIIAYLRQDMLKASNKKNIMGYYKLNQNITKTHLSLYSMKNFFFIFYFVYNNDKCLADERLGEGILPPLMARIHCIML